MPKINVYESQQGFNAPDVTPVDVGLYTNGGKAFSEVAKQVDDITQKFREIRNVRETTKASTDLQIELDQIENQAANDPNFDKPEVYQAKIDEAMSRHSQTITETGVRQQAMDKFRLKGYSSYSNVQGNFRKRQVEAAQYQLAKDIDTSKQAYIKTADPVKKQLFMDQAIDSLRANLRAGIISAESATSAEKAIKKEWASSEAMFDAETNPQMALTNLAAGNYKNLDDPNERRKVYNFANAMKSKQEKEIKAQAEEAKQKAVNEIYLDVLGGKASVESISSRVGVDINAKEAEHYIGMLAKDTQTVTDPTAYGRHLDSLYQAETKQQMSRAISALAEDQSIANSKRLELVKLSSVMKSKYDYPDEKEEKIGGNLLLGVPIIGALTVGYQLIKNSLRGKQANEAHDELISTIKPTDTDADIHKKTQAAISKTVVKNNPFLQNLSTTPKRVIDAYGNIGTVYLDENGNVQTEDDQEDGSDDSDTAE